MDLMDDGGDGEDEPDDERRRETHVVSVSSWFYTCDFETKF